MGLDITAYSRIEKVDAVFDADGEAIDPITREPFHYRQFVQMYVNPDFPGRAGAIEHRAVYKIGGDDFGFRAGSYGGYNEWRRWLAGLVGYTPDEAWRGDAAGKPFVEMVNFSDCEGVIGPEVCAKLAKDFAEWDERARAADDGPFFYERFQMWRKAFEMAADAGAVCFH